MASSMEECGYDEEFLDPVGDFLKCIICQLVLKVPVQIMKCGHRFCESCFNRMKSYSEQFRLPLCCPIDRDEIDMKYVFNDTGISRLVGDLRVKCSCSTSGCLWSGELRELDAHKGECGYTAKVSNSLSNNIPSEVSTVLELYHQRLVACEEKILEKEKDISYMQFNLQEIKGREKGREEEIEKLKLQNSELSREIVILKNQSQQDNNSTNEKCPSLDQLKTEFKEMNIKVEWLNQCDNDILKVKDSLAHLETKIETLDDKVKTLDEEFECFRNSFKKESFETLLQQIDQLQAQANHINDLVHYEENISLKKDTVFVWRINNFNEILHARNNFYSSKFYCRPKGHICQLMGQFSKEEGVFLGFRLSKGQKGADVSTFNCAVNVELIYNNGKRKKVTLTAGRIDAKRGTNFSLNGNNETWGLGWNNFFPKEESDTFLKNDRCTVVCTLTPEF